MTMIWEKEVNKSLFLGLQVEISIRLRLLEEDWK